MNNSKELEIIVKKELERIVTFINESNVFSNNKVSMVNKLAKKIYFYEKNRDSVLIKNFLINYYLFLGAIYSNDTNLLYSKNLKKNLLKSVSELKIYSNPSLLKKIPNAIIKIINTTHTQEEIDLIIKKEKIIEKESEKFTKNIKDLIGKQVGCINRSLCLDLVYSTKTYNENVLLLISDKTVKLIDFISKNSEDFICKNYIYFFENETLQIEKKQEQISIELEEQLDLKSAFFNFYLVHYKINNKVNNY